MILANFLDISSTAEAATKLQGLQMKVNEPLITYNWRYQAIHQVAFGLPPNEQFDKTAIIEYAKKLPQFIKEKLLRKITKKNSYIKTLDDAFKQAKEIDRESSFLDAESGRYNEQTAIKIETQINELDDCNVMYLHSDSNIIQEI